MSCKQEWLNMTLSSDMMVSSVNSFTMSKRFMKSFMRASILNILNQRLVLNQADLREKDLENTTVVVFKRLNVKDPLLRKYMNWIQGIADAIGKNYLKDLYLLLKNGENGHIIETYKFSFKYSPEPLSRSTRTSSCVKKATLQFFELINLLGTNGKLSENTDVGIELSYVETTPVDYEPPNFQAKLTDPHLTIPNCKILLGTLQTGFHKMICYGDGKVFKEVAFAPGSSEVLEQETVDNDQVNKSFDQDQEMTEDLRTDEEERFSKGIALNQINTSGITVSDVHNCSISFSEGSLVITEQHYNCLCKLPLKLDVGLIICSNCKKQFHAPCQGYRSKEAAISTNFVCSICSKEDGEEATEDRLLLFRLRLVLFYTEKRHQLPVELFKLFSESHRDDLLERMNNWNILTGPRNSKINMVALKKIMEKFYVNEDSQVFC